MDGRKRERGRKSTSPSIRRWRRSNEDSPFPQAGLRYVTRVECAARVERRETRIIYSKFLSENNFFSFFFFFLFPFLFSLLHSLPASLCLSVANRHL